MPAATQNPDLTRFNAPQNRTNGHVPGGPVLGPGDKAENQTDLVPALEGLTEQRKAKQTPNLAIVTTQGDEGCAKKSLRVLRAHKGTPSPALAERRWLLCSLLSAAPCICGGQECLLTERQSDDRSKSDPCVKVQLRSCTPPGRFL